MSANSSVILSEGEIYVLSAISGYRSVFAVSSKTMKQWASKLKKHISNTVKQLEKRMLIFSEPGGMVYVSKEISTIIRCLCEPERVAVISGTLFNGRRSEVYVLKCGRAVVTVKRIPAAYEIELSDSLDDEWIKALYSEASDGEEFSVRLSEKKAQEISEAAEGFDIERAQRLAEENVSDKKAAGCVLNCLSHKEKYFTLRCYKRNESLYVNVCDIFSVVCTETPVAVSYDAQNGDLRFESISEQKLALCYRDAMGEIDK